MTTLSLPEQMIQLAVDRLNKCNAFILANQPTKDLLLEDLKMGFYSHAVDVIDCLNPDTTIDLRMMEQARGLIVAVDLLQPML
jgi:hypothetical protein